MEFITIEQLINGYQSGEFTAEEVIEHYFRQIGKIESSGPRLNSFITIRDKNEVLEEIRERKLKVAIPAAHKDIYSTKGIETTAASNILKGYVPPYNATSVNRLNQAGYITLGKLNCDAFAHGTTGEISDFGPTKNPYSVDYVTGGSSSGSAAAVAAGLVPIATATDTGGSIRFPSGFNNVVGIKPTYGRASRYGVIAMTSSTDSIGHITQTVMDNARVLDITAGYDPLDATTAHNPKPESYLDGIDRGVKGLKLGIPTEFLKNIEPRIETLFQTAVSSFEKMGAEIVEVNLPHTEYAINAYYIITPSEVSSNLGRFDGIRFGHDRGYFGAEAKRRILMGTYCLSAGYYDAYYKKAQQVRTIIVNEYKNVFQEVDALITPISPVLTPKIGDLLDDPIANYMLDVLMVPINLAGVPSLAMPAGFINELPQGIQIIANHFEEQLLYRIGYSFEQETKYYQTKPKL